MRPKKIIEQTQVNVQKIRAFLYKRAEGIGITRLAREVGLSESAVYNAIKFIDEIAEDENGQLYIPDDYILERLQEQRDRLEKAIDDMELNGDEDAFFLTSTNLGGCTRHARYELEKLEQAIKDREQIIKDRMGV